MHWSPVNEVYPKLQTQADLFVLQPLEVEKFVQNLQIVEFSLSEYVPTPHAKHSVEPLKFENEPALQLRQGVEPFTALYFPGLQATHDAMP